MWVAPQCHHVLSFGPFDIEPGQTLPVSLAYVAGTNFHRSGDNFNNLPENPDSWYENMNFDSLGSNATWASWVYDNPGVDTDNNTTKGQRIENPCTGDSVYISGDGAPDFAGPPPPTVPFLRFSSSPGSTGRRPPARGI